MFVTASMVSQQYISMYNNGRMLQTEPFALQLMTSGLDSENRNEKGEDLRDCILVMNVAALEIEVDPSPF